MGKIKKFAVITDTNVRDPYALPICEKIKHAGYSVAVSYTHLDVYKRQVSGVFDSKEEKHV